GRGRRKMSGWIVPNTEILGPSNPASAGPACVPADLKNTPKHSAAIPNGSARSPNRTHTPPTPTHLARQRVFPHARGRKHADCGNNRSKGGRGNFLLSPCEPQRAFVNSG